MGASARPAVRKLPHPGTAASPGGPETGRSHRGHFSTLGHPACIAPARTTVRVRTGLMMTTPTLPSFDDRVEAYVARARHQRQGAAPPDLIRGADNPLALQTVRSSLIWALTGLALAPGAPMGLWLLFRVAEIDASAGAARLALIYSGIATAVVFASFGFWTGHLMDRLRRAAVHDGLTGLVNRRFLRESIPQAQAVAARRGRSLCVVMIDLDHFKQVNDAYGHLVGDHTLATVGRALREHSRRSDLVARYGGEEFAVLCPDADSEIGRQVAERLRAAIEQLGPEQLGHRGRQTVSLGVAVQPAGFELTPEQLLDQADLALYRAKHGGRNRTVVWLDGDEYGS